MWILVADDNDGIRQALLLLLKELGEENVTETRDMAEALEACRRGGAMRAAAVPGLVLLDWELPAGTHPDPDPTAFVAALREAAPGCRIIALSARPEARGESLRAGCDAFVSRTDPPDRLVELVTELQLEMMDRGSHDTPRLLSP